MNTRPTINAMTVDVEDYFHVYAFADRVRPSDWDHFESRVVPNTYRLLRLLGHHDVKATFFVLGWVADRHPRLITEIYRDGHEIGCHSFWHRLVFQLTPDEFRADLIRSRSVLEELTGEAVRLYRAPSFSITQQSLWAYDILAEEGFTIDSSVYPIYHDTYGIPDADPFPHTVQTAHGIVQEFPAAVHRLLGMNVPVSGGGYFRFYPFWWTQYCLRQINTSSASPFMFYVHPWETDPEQPRLSGSLKSRCRHYFHLAKTEDRLHRLLAQFQFASMSDALVADGATTARSLYTRDKSIRCTEDALVTEASEQLQLQPQIGRRMSAEPVL